MRHFDKGYHMNRKDACWIFSFILLVILLLAQISCSNWQGAEFRIGIGNYNGANETRTYQANKEVNKENKKY